MSHGWRVELDTVWNVLGPFPIHAREQHFVSPAYPVSADSASLRHPTSLTHTGYATWSQTTADSHGTIHVSHPAVPWDQIRATQGWAGLQHLNVLQGRLSVYPPSDLTASSDPFVRAELLQGAFFAILPLPDSPERKTCVPEWHYGNIYTLERAPAQLVRLPVPPARNREGSKYEVIVCAPYEIRLFGDPNAYSSPHPILTLNFSVSPQLPCSPAHSLRLGSVELSADETPLQQVVAHSVAPYIVDGTPFGNALGIGIQCLDFGSIMDIQGSWSVVHAHLISTSSHLPSTLSVALLDEVPIPIAPTQTRIIPLRLYISAIERIPEQVKQLDVEIFSTFQPTTELASSHVQPRASIIRATLPLTHVSLWTQEDHIPIRASYFFAGSMPTIFLVKPPKEVFGNSRIVPGGHDTDTSKCRGNKPILALHGAGVDILTQSFWADSLPRQKYAWIVMPQGRTAWGLDWHGPSAADAFATVSALAHILSDAESGRWAKWGFVSNTRVILMGHSNGGQGAWYMASRWPDRVCAVVPAAGYIKSQAYVSLCMSRFAHFIDPMLRAILDSSLTPDDNDLFLGNLVGKPVLALNGGADDNVPPWQTREQVGILKTWDPNTDVTYHEDPGQPHWYFEILSNERVQAFLDRVYFPLPSSSANQECKTTNFTLTVSVPAESGSLNGWRIYALTTPGLLGRLRVNTTRNGQVSVRTTNVSVFSLDPTIWDAKWNAVEGATVLEVDGDDILIDFNGPDDTFFIRDIGTTGFHRKSPWKILPRTDPRAARCLRAPPQRLQSILSTHGRLTLLVPSFSPSPELSAALRIAHTLQLFHALDAQIISIVKLEATRAPADIGRVLKGNIVVIGCAESPLVRRWLERAGGTWKYTDGAWHLGTVRFERPSSAILFCQPHPYNGRGITLFLQSTDVAGLERAVRLFPIRTGVVSPDWLVVDGRADTIGAAGVQGAGVYASDSCGTGNWVWNERMSWLD